MRQTLLCTEIKHIEVELHAVCFTKLGHMQNISMGEGTSDLFTVKAKSGSSKNSPIKVNDRELMVVRNI